MIPTLSVVGKSSRKGKTAVICTLIESLKKRGYRVATIKHDVHGFEIDKPGKDTYRHAAAGSDVVMISSPWKFAMIEKRSEEYRLDEILAKLTAIDLVLTEGYKSADKPKLEVYRTDVGQELLCNESELFAIVTDTPLRYDVPQFSFDQLELLVDHVESHFLNAKPGAAGSGSRE